MTEQDTAALLAEIRDLMRRAGEKQDKALAMQQEALERQREAMALQAKVGQIASSSNTRQKVVLAVMAVLFTVVLLLMALSVAAAFVR